MKRDGREEPMPGVGVDEGFPNGVETPLAAQLVLIFLIPAIGLSSGLLACVAALFLVLSILERADEW